MQWQSLWYPLVLTTCPRGWTFRVICSQNWELKLETCDPELINTVTFCPSTITGASLVHPTRWATGSGFKKGTTEVASCVPVHWATLIQTSLCWGLGWECEEPTVGWGSCCQGVNHIPSVPPSWFKAMAGVGHSPVMWPHPWHLKHWRVWVSIIGHAFLPCTGPLATLSISSIPGVPCPTASG